MLQRGFKRRIMTKSMLLRAPKSLTMLPKRLFLGFKLLFVYFISILEPRLLANLSTER